jgi:hypothetical protein
MAARMVAAQGGARPTYETLGGIERKQVLGLPEIQ